MEILILSFLLHSMSRRQSQFPTFAPPDNVPVPFIYLLFTLPCCVNRKTGFLTEKALCRLSQ